jgi:hypothetical protein
MSIKQTINKKKVYRWQSVLSVNICVLIIAKKGENGKET